MSFAPLALVWLLNFNLTGAAPTNAVLQHHNGPDRGGRYVAPELDSRAAGRFERARNFSAAYDGAVYAQPLYWDAGPGGTDLLIVATEHNEVIAFRADTGAVVWKKSLGTPMPLSRLPCGNIDPLGVTGTPVIDPASKTLYVAAMTTPDGGTTALHRIFALSLEDGSLRAGWPVDLSNVSAGGVRFDSKVQNQRGALALSEGVLYVPYGGHFGDCGEYHGWVVGVPVNNPANVQAWRTVASGGGVWAPAGVTSDGDNLFIGTGNTFGAETWSDGESVLRLLSGPAFTAKPTDYFAPSNWRDLDRRDLDIGGTAPLAIEVPGANPSKLLVALGKDGKAYLLDRENLGGVGGEIQSLQVSRDRIINAAAAYPASNGALVVFHGRGIGCPARESGDLTAIRITASSPPTMHVEWCAEENGRGSPIVSTTNGRSSPIVWTVGAEGDNRLRAFDGETGKVLFTASGQSQAMGTVRRFQSPIIAKGKLFVAGDGQVYEFADKAAAAGPSLSR